MKSTLNEEKDQRILLSNLVTKIREEKNFMFVHPNILREIVEEIDVVCVKLQHKLHTKLQHKK